LSIISYGRETWSLTLGSLKKGLCSGC